MPDQSRRDCKRNRGRRIAGRVEGPIERRTNVIELRRVHKVPVGVGHAQKVVGRAFEQVAEVPCVPTFDSLRLFGLIELLEHVGAGGLK